MSAPFPFSLFVLLFFFSVAASVVVIFLNVDKMS